MARTTADEARSEILEVQEPVPARMPPIVPTHRSHACQEAPGAAPSTSIRFPVRVTSVPARQDTDSRTDCRKEDQ